MATNVEIKARVGDPGRLQALVEALSDTPATVIPQEDVFFCTPGGRLKLRVLAPDEGQLIYYEREDASGPKQSNYMLSCTGEPDTLQAVLAGALGVRGIVRKRRVLYMVGNTRVHLDQVEGLGSFMELEVVLGSGQSEEEGQAIATELMEKLEIKGADLIEVAYIDLLEAGAADQKED
jgi:predicted adenylyl cyclase CyaB